MTCVVESARCQLPPIQYFKKRISETEDLHARILQVVSHG